MAHDPPLPGKVLTAGRLQALDDRDTFTPVLTATTTNPNLGADGFIEGSWQRNGHLITAWVGFQFAGTGVDAGSGIYEISLPFAADTSLVTASGNAGAGSALGSGFYDGSSDVVLMPYVNSGADTVRLTSTGGVVTDSNPFVPADGDEGVFVISYPADPTGL